jgi:prepilin signal peptidase PulO-like enzyme (type II secretory pathway)
MLLFSFFVLGAITASFIGVVADRLSTGQSFLSGRSRCDACNTPLPFLSLIPLVSYGASFARAHCCGTRLSPAAPLFEATLGTLFLLSYLRIGLTIALPWFLIALSLLGGLVLYDLRHQILPPKLLGAFFLVSALSGFLLSPSVSFWAREVFVAFCIGGMLALVYALSRGKAMGLADAPLAGALALLVGPAALSGFLFSFWIGAVIGIFLLAQRPHGSRMGVEVPFAPFLAAGFILAYVTQWNPLIFLAGLL